MDWPLEKNARPIFWRNRISKRANRTHAPAEEKSVLPCRSKCETNAAVTGNLHDATQKLRVQKCFVLYEWSGGGSRTDVNVCIVSALEEAFLIDLLVGLILADSTYGRNKPIAQYNRHHCHNKATVVYFADVAHALSKYLDSVEVVLRRNIVGVDCHRVSYCFPLSQMSSQRYIGHNPLQFRCYYLIVNQFRGLRYCWESGHGRGRWREETFWRCEASDLEILEKPDTNFIDHKHCISWLATRQRNYRTRKAPSAGVCLSVCACHSYRQNVYLSAK